MQKQEMKHTEDQNSRGTVILLSLFLIIIISWGQFPSYLIVLFLIYFCKSDLLLRKVLKLYIGFLSRYFYLDTFI